MESVVQIPRGATWVRFPRFVGDAVMQLPILRLLRQMAIGPIVVYGPSPTVSLVKDHELADVVVAETKKTGILDLSRILRQHRPARSIHFTKSLRPGVAAWLANVPERIGVSDGGLALFNTHHAPFWNESGPFVMRYHAALVRRWPDLPGLPFANYVPAVQIDKPNDNYICLMPGSVWPSKSWPVEHFQAIARKAGQSNLDIIVLGSASERELGDAILRNCRGQNLCGLTDLRQAAAYLYGAVAAVGNDSGLSHLAAACGTRVIAIYGPTDPNGSAPWGPNVVILKPKNLVCAPCFKRQCPLPRRNCLYDISPDQVWELYIGLTTNS